MSGDERDKSRRGGDTENAEQGGTADPRIPGPQVPSQGGRSEPGAGTGAGTGTGGRTAAGLPGLPSPRPSQEPQSPPPRPLPEPDASTRPRPHAQDGSEAPNPSGGAAAGPGLGSPSGSETAPGRGSRSDAETGSETGSHTGSSDDASGAPSGGGARASRTSADDEDAPTVPTQRDGLGGGVLPPPRDAERAPSDADLVERMRAGDDTAYEKLYRRHAEAVRRYARTCCRDADTADDLTAEVFARTLQAVRGGSGPQHAVRAYLLTTVRRVAASWTKSAKREHLVEDFAVFATQATRTETADGASSASFGAGLDLGADVRALHEAERSMAMRAFRSLPERWQAVLWHTEVEDESPSEVATLFGLDANGTRVLASRAREGLKQAYLQAHVSAALATNSAECARYADRLGAYARGGLRARAERGLRKHLEECAACRLAAGQIKEVAGGIPAVVPVAVIGWFGAAGYAKAAALVAGGTGVGAAGAAGAAAGAAGSGGAAGASGGAAGGSGAGGAAVSEGLAAPVKAGLAAGVVAVAAAAVALALIGDTSPKKPVADPPPPTRQVVSPPAPKPSTAPSRTPARTPAAAPAATKAPSAPAVGAAPTPTPERSRSPRPAAAAPTPQATPKPTPEPSSPPSPDRSAPPPEPQTVYRWNALKYDLTGDGKGPDMQLAGSSWVWQRHGLSIAGRRYAGGVTVHGSSSVTVDLNRACTSFDALVGIDDLNHEYGRVRFSVHADGVRLWRSPQVRAGDAAVPLHVNLAGRRSVRLVVEPHSHFDGVALADWAESRFTCG